MKITRFEDIVAWQKAKCLSIDIYRAFQMSKDFGFRDQIQRASVSIMNNIAEGFERQTNREFKQFLFIAKGSCAEVRSMLYLAEELGYLKESAHVNLSDETVEITKILNGLIKSIKTNRTNRTVSTTK